MTLGQYNTTIRRQQADWCWRKKTKKGTNFTHITQFSSLLTSRSAQSTARHFISLLHLGFAVTLLDDILNFQAKRDCVLHYIYFGVKICTCRNLGLSFTNRSDTCLLPRGSSRNRTHWTMSLEQDTSYSREFSSFFFKNISKRYYLCSYWEKKEMEV